MDGAIPSSSCGGIHPRTHHERLDGYRDQRNYGVRGDGQRQGGRSHGDRIVGLSNQARKPCPNSPPTSRCSTTSIRSWTASPPLALTALRPSNFFFPTHFPKRRSRKNFSKMGSSKC